MNEETRSRRCNANCAHVKANGGPGARESKDVVMRYLWAMALATCIGCHVAETHDPTGRITKCFGCKQDVEQLWHTTPHEAIGQHRQLQRQPGNDGHPWEPPHTRTSKQSKARRGSHNTRNKNKKPRKQATITKRSDPSIPVSTGTPSCSKESQRALRTEKFQIRRHMKP